MKREGGSLNIAHLSARVDRGALRMCHFLAIAVLYRAINFVGVQKVEAKRVHSPGQGRLG